MKIQSMKGVQVTQPATEPDFKVVTNMQPSNNLEVSLAGVADRLSTQSFHAANRKNTLQAMLNNASQSSHAVALAQLPRGTEAVEIDPLATKKVSDPLGIESLQPVKGQLGGPPLVIFDNPETFSTLGVLGSTISSVPGRGNAQYDLLGAARNYVLTQNNTGHAQRFSIVVQNKTDKPLTFTARGVQYVKGTTKTDGAIEIDYINDPTAKGRPEFRGPQAIAAHSYLSEKANKNGFVQKTVTVPPRGTAVLTDIYHPPGAEVFSLLNIEARSPDRQRGKFGVAAVSSPKSLTTVDLNKISHGQYPAAGQEFRSEDRKRKKGGPPESDFASAGSNKMGRPNGVISKGSVFTGGRRVEVGSGRAQGDLLLATRFKNAKSTTEIGHLTSASVLPNPGKVGPAATSDDGNYGVTYKLNYTLVNSSKEERDVRVLLTAPRKVKGETSNPDGGEITLPVKVKGQIVKVRVDHRGEGRVLATIRVPAQSEVKLPIEFTNFGNIYPPAGIEFR